MLKGLGCDMIEVERIRQALSRPSFLLLGGQRGGEQGAGHGL